NADTIATNEHVDYTVDTTPPSQNTWAPAKSDTITTTAPTITFNTNENADCKWSLTDQAYADMLGDCTGDGTIAQSCVTAGLIEGAEIVYVACRDAALNADTIATNEHVDYLINTAPVANAGPDQSLIQPCVPSAIALDGSASSDADGNPLTYAWSQTGGPAVVLSSSTVQVPTFTPVATGTYTFSLTVNDGIINSAADSVTITMAVTPGAPPLGSACAFGVMAIATITNTGASTVNGDVSLNPPGIAITGFPPGVVTGVIHNGDATAALAKQDLLSAYNYAKGLTPDLVVGTVDLGTLILPPGVYSSGSTMSVTTNLVLDGGGNPNAVWVFQIGSSLTLTAANVTVTNSAQAKNVFWVPTASASIGGGTTFSGNILAGVSVTCVTGAIINGRVFAGAIDNTGAVTLDTNTINVPLP
ncbi:MAG: ice-binding family protein, partial [bacterium]